MVSRRRDIRSLAQSIGPGAKPARAMASSRLAWMAAFATVVMVAGVTYYLLGGSSKPSKYVIAEVSRGPIVRAVTATGTINPVTTVPVGSYVSGPIIAIYADFNSPVKEGQLIAKIDAQPFELKLAESQALLENGRAALTKDEADMRYKKLLYERNRGLLALGAVAQNTVDNDLSGYQQALAQTALDRAQIKQQKAALQDAEVNLNYANIKSPVNGTVVARNVDVGQTVAASFQTPTLFLIAKDLTQMQVDCNVSESDIGGVYEGQIATFKVDAFPDTELQGVVQQVRQAPITVQNVVTYDVVLRVANPELLLKPGMTANVNIVTAKRDDVLRIPIRALHFVPHRIAKLTRSQGAAESASAQIPRQARIWVRHGPLIKAVEITTGLSDDNYVEVIGEKLRIGEKVVIDEHRNLTPVQAAATPRLP
jgi:HlyD family secretion protein